MSVSASYENFNQNNAKSDFFWFLSRRHGTRSSCLIQFYDRLNSSCLTIYLFIINRKPADFRFSLFSPPPKNEFFKGFFFKPKILHLTIAIIAVRMVYFLTFEALVEKPMC